MMRARAQIVGFSAAVLSASTGSAQVTQRVTVGSAGIQGNDMSLAAHSVTHDGRFLAFESRASNLVPGDSNLFWDIFLRDRSTGTTERVSVGSGGIQGNGHSSDLSFVSADGRFVAFSSWASNLVPGDTNGTVDVFLRDRVLGSTTRLSESSSGAQANSSVYLGDMTPDARYVVLAGWATNLVPGATSGLHVFVRDRSNGTTELVSVDSNGSQGNGWSYASSISDDGRFVGFVSEASNLVSGDSNGDVDVFVHDRLTAATERVSIAWNGSQANVSGDNNAARISGDGRYMAYVHDATNLVPGDTNGVPDVFVRDRQGGTTERVNVSSAGLQANGASTLSVGISDDGRFVGFGSYANNLVPGDTNGVVDAFVRDRLLASTERVGQSATGGPTPGGTAFLSMSSDGRFVSFQALAGLVADDTNGLMDGYLRDRLGGTTFASLCEPGVGGVIPCPCSNAPTGPGRGCDNSAATGGAVLAATGGTFLSSDSLVFTTSGQKPTGLSIVSQWMGTNGSGVIFGQGVRCTGGVVKRLYTKLAAGGSITAPDFGAGDPAVSARSAAKGDTIQPAQSRWYLVYYRDSVVLGGCPATSTFNATQTGVVLWSP